MNERPGRAAAELRHAAATPCAACGRETKTVEGVCAECWEPKEPGARVLRPTPKPTPLLDLDFDPTWGYLALAGIAAILIALAAALWPFW